MTVDLFSNLQKTQESQPDRIAFQLLTGDGKETFSYGQVAREVRGISRFLQKEGIEPGHRVAILMENHPRWGIAFMAAQSAGAVLVPLDILHAPETLHGLIEHAEASYAIVSAGMIETLEKIQSMRAVPLRVLVVGDSKTQYPDWDSVLCASKGCETPMPLVPRTQDDPLMVLYTSGTTGDPKGVVLSYRNIYINVAEVLKKVQLSEQDNILGVLPLYHILALMVNFIIPLTCRARVTFLDALDAPRILGAFEQEGVTIFVCVPQFFYVLHRRIMQEIEKQGSLKQFLFWRLVWVSRKSIEWFGYNPGRVFFPQIHRRLGTQFRFFGVGGARFDADVARSFQELGFLLVQAYGMTETAAISTITSPDWKGIGSVGRPLPHVELRIERPDDQGIGEVLVRGPHVMKGYLKNPTATDQAIDRDGWLHTGDLGYLDSEGFLYITGRKKDVIVLSSGKNIFPEEIEHFYQQNCPFIKEICVLGVAGGAGDHGQERLHAVIVPDFDYLKTQQVANVSDMIRYLMENLSQQLPSYKRIHSFEIRQTPLPRTTTRKIKRFQVEQERSLQATSPIPGQPLENEPVEEFEDPLEQKIRDLIFEIKGHRPLARMMNLELDLGFDSLERVELISNLQERFGVVIEDEEASGLLTVNDLFDTVRDRLSSDAIVSENQLRSWSEILREPLDQADSEKVRERLRRRPVVEFLFVLFARFCLVVFKLFFRLKVEGKENIPDDFPYMLCPNHLSYLDAFVVGAPLPASTLRRYFSLGYSDYFQTGLLSFLGRLAKVIPVDADRHLRQALRLAAEGLNRNMVLCVFPEGERSIDGRLKPFRKGPAILATEMKVPVIPVGIKGTFEAWRRGSNKVRLHPIQLRYGKPLFPGENETIVEFNHRLAAAVAELVQQ
ncbi:MAG TPA: AMP-binding protein [Acidobacteriota bacterium]|nr:AMP-binding protein [Acidobacteriota bacterium]